MKKKNADWKHCENKKQYGWSHAMPFKLVHHPAKGMIEGHNWGGNKQEYLDRVKEERRYVVIYRLSMERMKLQTHQPLD